MSHFVQIIDNKDYQNDNYYLSAGKFVTDLVAVSSLALVSPTIDTVYYLGIPSTKFIKWEVTSPNNDHQLIYKKASKNCSSVTQGGYLNNINTENYSIPLSSVTATSTSNTITGYNPDGTPRIGSAIYVPDFSLVATWLNNGWTRVVGGRGSSGDPNAPGVSTCLKLPYQGFSPNEIAFRTFTMFTLSGVDESVRLVLTRAPSAVVKVSVADNIAGLNVGTFSLTVFNYDLTSNVSRFNNQVDNWYVNVTGLMFPDISIINHPNWKMAWTFESDNSTEEISAFYISNDGNTLGSPYYVGPISEKVGIDKVQTVSQTFPSIDKIRVYFTEPGRKKISLHNVKSTQTLSSLHDPDNYNFTYTLTTNYFNNRNGLDLQFVSADYSTSFDKIQLSAISFFNDGTRKTFLDSTFPDIRWKWDSLYENPIYDSNPASAFSIKNSMTSITQSGSLASISNDFVEFRALQPAVHTITLYSALNDTISATYKWQTFSPTSIFLEYSYDNCLENRFVNASALTTFRNQKELFNGVNADGSPLVLRWNWSTNNVNAFSTQRNIPRNTLLEASQANPAKFIFNNPETTVRSLCSTVFSVSTNNIPTPNNYREFTLNYDLKPRGYDIDLVLNYEKSSEIDNTFYRILEPQSNNYNIILKGMIKPDINTNWLTGGDLNVLPNASTKLYYYYNDNKNDIKGYGGVHSFNASFLTHNYHISSITFVADCLSASPIFGYGHTKTKTVDLRLYKDSFVPKLCSVVFPEYYFNFPFLTSLLVNPNEYWTYNPRPYPSAYGEGRTNLFLASAFDNNFNFYDEFSWSIKNFGDKIISDSLTFSIPSQPNQTDRTEVIIGGFNSNLQLLNTTLSTYKSDVDGSIQVFKNWKKHEVPILTTTYDNFSSVEIKSDYRVEDNVNAIFTFYLDFKYPSYSPMSVNPALSIVRWDITSDRGDVFSSTIEGSLEYSIGFNLLDRNINTLFVNARATVAEYIPNYDVFTINYNPRYTTYDIPSPLPSRTPFNASFVNFTLSSIQNPESLIDVGTDRITAIAPLTLSGFINSAFVNPTINWKFGDYEFPTNQMLLTSISILTEQIIPITLRVNTGSFIIEKTKSLILNPKFDLDWKIFSENIFIKINDRTYFYNESVGPIPLSSYYYKFEDEDETVKLNYGETFYKTFTSTGSKNLYVTAIDIKGFSYKKVFNNIVSVIEDWEKYIPNLFLDENLQTKYTFDDIKVSPNDWTVANIINDSFDKIYENLIYLEDVSKFYDKPPYKLLGWYGYTGNRLKWNYQPYDSNYNFINNSENRLRDLVSYNIINDKYVLFSYKNKIEIKENSYYSNLLVTKDERSVNDFFFDIKNTVIDKDDNIIILDAFNFGTVTIFQYDPLSRNAFKYIAKFGGLGSKESKNKFKNANDLTINYKDELFIADTGNRVVKKFTKTGGWLETFESPLFNPDNSEEDGTVENGSVISSSCGENDLIYCLTKDYVVVFDGGQVIGSFLWRNNLDKKDLTPIKICASSDDNIVYVLCEEIAIKYTKDGYFIGYIGETPEEYTTEISNFKYTNITHSKSKVLNLISENFILSYSDLIVFLFIKPDIKNFWWQKDKLRIHPEEFVDYWVYNRVFSRIWDNLDYFRRSLQARVLFFKDINDKITYKLYKRDDFYKQPFKYSKDDVLIGVNELVTADVINRSLFRLYNSGIELLNMITSQKVRYRWIDTIEVGVTPLKWYESKSDENKPLRWGNAIS